MKKAFTLIELLSVIVLLAIIALIATPVVLKVVDSAKEKADFESANGVVDSARLYFSEALLDIDKQGKINNLNDIYSDVVLNNKPEFGQLYVNNKGNVAMAIIINNKCYKKEFMGKIEKTEVSDCDLGYIGIDEIPPTISQEVISGTINSNGWYKEDIYIKINIEDSQSGVLGYKRCISQVECEPNEDIHTNNNIIVTTESASNYVCVIGVDKYGNESEKNCEIYKLDKTKPALSGISDITITIGESIDLLNGVEAIDSLSGIVGDISINPNTVDTSIAGTTPVTYMIYDKAGNTYSVVRNIIVDAEAPTVTYEVLNNAINVNGWAKEAFYVKATIIDNSNTGIKTSKSCSNTTSSECTPVAEFTGNEKSFYISTEGSNRLCIEVTDNNNKTTKLCSDIYKLDKTAPLAGTATFTGTLGSNDWYTSNVTVNVVNGTDSLSGHNTTTSNITSITSNTTGTTITLTTTDLAGNTSTRDYTLKVDKTAPTLTAKSENVSIMQGNNILTSTYFNAPVYSISGGNISCNPVNTSSLGAGNQIITCTATGNNGLSSSINKTITVMLDYTVIRPFGLKPVVFKDRWDNDVYSLSISYININNELIINNDYFKRYSANSNFFKLHDNIKSTTNTSNLYLTSNNDLYFDYYYNYPLVSSDVKNNFNAHSVKNLDGYDNPRKFIGFLDYSNTYKIMYSTYDSQSRPSWRGYLTLSDVTSADFITIYQYFLPSCTPGGICPSNSEYYVTNYTYIQNGKLYYNLINRDTNPAIYITDNIKETKISVRVTNDRPSKTITPRVVYLTNDNQLYTAEFANNKATSYKQSDNVRNFNTSELGIVYVTNNGVLYYGKASTGKYSFSQMATNVEYADLVEGYILYKTQNHELYLMSQYSDGRWSNPSLVVSDIK